MRQLSMSEVEQDFTFIMDTAQKEPIIVKKADQDNVAIISMQDYEDLVKLRQSCLKKLAEDIGIEAQKNGLTPEILQEILNSDT